MIFCPFLLGSSGYRCPTSCQIYATCATSTRSEISLTACFNVPTLEEFASTLLPAQKTATPIIKAMKECNLKDQGDQNWNCWDSPVFLSSMSCWDYALRSDISSRIQTEKFAGKSVRLHHGIMLGYIAQCLFFWMPPENKYVGEDIQYVQEGFCCYIIFMKGFKLNDQYKRHIYTS